MQNIILSERENNSKEMQYKKIKLLGQGSFGIL